MLLDTRSWSQTGYCDYMFQLHDEYSLVTFEPYNTIHFTKPQAVVLPSMNQMGSHNILRLCIKFFTNDMPPLDYTFPFLAAEQPHADRIPPQEAHTYVEASCANRTVLQTSSNLPLKNMQQRHQSCQHDHEDEPGRQRTSKTTITMKQPTTRATLMLKQTSHLARFLVLI